MESERSYSNNDPDPSSEILLHQNRIQYGKNLQTNCYSTEVTNENNLNQNRNQQYVPSNESANVKEISKIVGIIIQILIFSVFISITVRPTFRAPKSDDGNMTHIGTVGPRLKVQTTTPDDDTENHMVTAKDEMTSIKEIHVSSRNEYNKKVENIPMSVPISLYISADKPSDLTSYGNLPRSMDISEVTIKGYIDPNHLYELLVQLRNVSNIVIIESNSIKYKNTKVIMKRGPKVIFKNLKSIKFRNITSGNHIYPIFSTNFLMTGVNFLEFSETKMTEENISAMRRLLEHFKYSLRTLLFPNVHWNSVLFQNFVCVFPNLVELRLDFLSQIHMNDNLLGTLYKNAPNLKRLVSKHGYLRLSHLSSVTSLKHVESLSFGLLVPARLDYLDVSILTKYLPLLGFLELSLRFDDTSKCKVLESDKVKRKLSLTYFTECDLDVVNH